MDSLTKTLLQVSLGGSAWVLWLLLGLSVASLAIMIERGWVFFRHRFGEDDFIAQLRHLLGEGGWTSAINLCKESRALEAQVLLAGLQHMLYQFRFVGRV